RPQIHISARILSIPGSRTISHESQNSLTEQKNISPGLAGLRKILKGEKINPEIIPRNDHSVRFWNAPSVYREIEAVANDILYKMSIDSDLTYLDFAILVTDMQAYRPAVESVFDGGILLRIANRKDEISGNSMPVRKKLPYSLTDIKASESSLLYRGLTDFWDACSANGIRKEAVLHLLHNPLFSSKWNLDEEAILEIDKLISESGMQYEEKNNEKDPFQISNSLRRIRLSSVLDPDSSWLNHRLSSIVLDSHKAAVNLTEIWETIHSGKETVHSVLQNGNWNSRNIERIQNVVEELFGFSGLSENELNLFQNWKEALAGWEGLESEQDKYKPGQKENIKEGLELLRFITEQAFEKIPYRKGSYLTGGVTISLLQPMRPIPFKNVYILGLGEGKFPGSPDMSQLNLRRDVQEEWDISRREVQESLLWESLHSAEASLTLSYVGKNLLEDKTFEPCSSLLELMQCFGIQNAIEIPLHSYSDRYTHSKEELNKGLVSFDFSRIWINSDRKNHPLLKQFQDPDSLENLQEETKRTSIDVRELSEFLSDPLETYLKKKLGMYSGEEEEPTEEGEVFSLEALAESIVLKKLHLQMFPDIVSDKPWSWDEKKIRAELGTVIVEEIASARFPQSIYAKVQEKKLLGYLIITSHILESWRTSLLGGTYHRYISLGDTGLHKEICKKLPGLKINLLDAKQKNIPDEIEIRGEWEHVIEKDGAYFWLFSKSLEAKPEFDWKGYKDYWKTMSRPFLSAVALGTTLNNFWIYSFRSRPSYPEGGNENTLLLHYKFTEPTEKKNPSGYLKKLILNYLREEPFFFPRKAFLKYYTREIQQGKSKKSGPDLVQKYDAVDDWKIFLHEEIESIQSDLPPIVGLYPKTGELILSSEISWAKEFYKPFLDWKEEG
ncbi:MAG: exodeoxyribonuclease V subunit gamma, partial [Leptospira sp.]|nr:exodeoxyribonuclease V subunit gamma [Leptospira sp.]